MSRRLRRPARGPDPPAARLVGPAVAILETILTVPKPADYLIAQYFRRHPSVAGPEKGTVVEWVYCALRRARYDLEIARAAGFSSSRLAHAAMFLSLWDSGALDRRALLRALAADAALPPSSFDALAAFARVHADLDFVLDEIERIALRRGFPGWVAERLVAAEGRESAEAILDGLNARPQICLRANREQTTRDALGERLASEGLSTRPGSLSPDALILLDGADVFATEAFRKGHFEVQDEGSQVISLLVAPRAGWRVLDACAGACGKTLHLGALMKGRGEVFAFDTDARRLANGARRVRRSGLQNVRILDDPDRFTAFADRFAGALDAVLVDAPCTGLGTVRRSPDIKLRAEPRLLDAMNAKQREILDTYAPFPRPGGRLVYATCSVLEEENGAIVDDFLVRHPEYRLVPVSDVVDGLHDDGAYTSLRGALAGATTMRLYPHVHTTDGFFAAVLERR